MSTWDEGLREEEDVVKLNEILAEWRVPGPMQLVRPRYVIPDTCNRENTGLSAVHAHWIASQISLNGFTKRDNKNGTGHDVPIVVQESESTDLGDESLRKWRRTSSESPRFPQIMFSNSPFFTSLGSGHFFQGRCLNIKHADLTCVHQLIKNDSQLSI